MLLELGPFLKKVGTPYSTLDHFLELFGSLQIILVSFRNPAFVMRSIVLAVLKIPFSLWVLCCSVKR